MAIDHVEVNGDVDDHGFIVLRVNYPSALMIRTEMTAILNQQFTQEYLDAARDADHKSCFVNIDADVAASPLVRALFDLYKRVKQEGGELVCAGYPIDYLPRNPAENPCLERLIDV